MRETARLLADLVATDSVNPGLVPGGAGEAAAARLVADRATAAGLAVDWHERTPGRPSVVVTARGRGGGRTLLLCGHLDTVTTAGMTDPLAPRVEGDRLHGRGAYDMKGGLAAALGACADAAALGLAGDVVVACVADEEHASLGVQEVLETVRADAAIVTEPTGLDVVVAHKGFVWADLTVSGRAAHGSMPEEGVDAIVRAGPVLTALGALDARMPVHPLLGRASVHASLIRGGEERSSYPAECVIAVERRTLPGEAAAQVAAELDALGADTVQIGLTREPFAIDPGHWLPQAVAGAAGSTTAGAPFWTDAAFIAAAGIPTVLFGPAGAGAHAAVEWVDLPSVERVRQVLVAVARKVCA